MEYILLGLSIRGELSDRSREKNKITFTNVKAVFNNDIRKLNIALKKDFAPNPQAAEGVILSLFDAHVS